MDLSRKKLFVISRNTVRYTTRRTWDVKRERRLEEEGGEKTTSERGESSTFSSSRWRYEITENPRRLRATWFVPCYLYPFINSCSFIHASLLSFPFFFLFFLSPLYHHLVIRYVSHAPLFFQIILSFFFPNPASLQASFVVINWRDIYDDWSCVCR